MKRKTKYCQNCDRHISLSNFNKHKCNLKKHVDYSDQYILLENGKCKCLHCDKEYTLMGISTHIWRSHGEGQNHNPNIDNEGNPHPSWCKGLTKETNNSLKKASQTRLRGFKEGKIIPSQLGKPLSEEHKEKISKSIQKNVKEGTWHYSFSKVRTHEYISSSAGKVRLHGSWEIAYAKYLDENNIRWRRPSQKTDKFYYEYEKLKNGSGYYIPDFYLIDTNEWIEVKGYETDKDRAKWKWFPHTLKVIKGDDLQALNLI